MTKLLVWLLALAVLAGTATMLRTYAPSDASQTVAAATMTAPFRDGLYLGRRAAEQGENRHVSSGRWSSREDRASFVAGYQLGYASATLPINPAYEATNGAFRDGLHLGKFDAEHNNDLHIASGRWARQADRDSFTAGYQEAYAKVFVARMTDANVQRAAK